ncbi:MAG: asparagine synthase (glutamine-hydrolyzing) [Pseudomonadales bacterium]|nr:asparagine synthase (glutamine-hydrolyzing) [Pseudomonadales bacterium]MCP5185821.1 asparagine synthase (glutamine-hydrolyzing) [Pseudomonadales bacterium]
MCGIAGILSPTGDVDAGKLSRMSVALTHRGPDAHGIWQDTGIGLVHRRLAVVDLSPAGAQPMLARSGRYVLSYNGEIYNANALRNTLSNAEWRGHSDTEVLLALIERHGPVAALDLVDGMFAFALWDRHDQCLWLARDRLGEKPLFYGWLGNCFVFASEPAALRAAWSGELTLDIAALAGYLRHNYLPALSSPWREISKVAPGTLLRLNHAEAVQQQPPEVIPYWQLTAAVAQSGDPPSDADLLAMLRRSVSRRLTADVPVGTFLSGGIDSTLITALACEASPTPVQSFTMGFADAVYDEAPHAARIASHLGTRHTSVHVNETNLLNLIEELPTHLGEPFADSSFLPTFLLSRLMRQHVTVALSGDGGDELFHGYGRYALWERACRLRGLIPPTLRRPLSRLLNHRLAANIARRLSWRDGRGRTVALDNRLRGIGDLINAPDDLQLYRAMISHSRAPAEYLAGRGIAETPTVYASIPAGVGTLPAWRQPALLDTLAYLPDDILTKVDRASMAVSLETRVPLLDHHLVAAAFRLPREHLIDADGAKAPLRRLLSTYVPPALTQRPKQGFAVPINRWLREPLRPWLIDTLNPRTLEAQGVLNSTAVIAMRDNHLAGRAERGAQLWDFAILTAWLAAGNQASRP